MLKRIIKYIVTLGGNTQIILSLFREENAKPLNNNKNLHIHKIAKHYLGSNVYSFGKKNKKKFFYLINRSPGAGFFSNVNFVLNQLLICQKSKYFVSSVTKKILLYLYSFISLSINSDIILGVGGNACPTAVL